MLEITKKLILENKIKLDLNNNSIKAKIKLTSKKLFIFINSKPFYSKSLSEKEYTCLSLYFENNGKENKFIGLIKEYYPNTIQVDTLVNNILENYCSNNNELNVNEYSHVITSYMHKLFLRKELFQKLENNIKKEIQAFINKVKNSYRNFDIIMSDNILKDVY